MLPHQDLAMFRIHEDMRVWGTKLNQDDSFIRFNFSGQIERMTCEDEDSSFGLDRRQWPVPYTNYLNIVPLGVNPKLKFYAPLHYAVFHNLLDAIKI